MSRKRITALTLALLAMLVFGLSAAPVSSASAPPDREKRVGSPDPQHAALESEDSSSVPLGNPTFVIYPTDDADVYERYPDTNYGSDTSIYVQPWKNRRNRGFLKFDLSSIPEDVVIIEAKLHLYAWRKKYKDFSVGVYGILSLYDSWSEDTITWNNQPFHMYYLAFDTEWINGTGWYTWDATSFVVDEFAGDKIVSLCLRGTYPETQGGLAFFDSKEWYRNHPYLEISVSVPPVEETGTISFNGATLDYRVAVGYPNTPYMIAEAEGDLSVPWYIYLAQGEGTISFSDGSEAIDIAGPLIYGGTASFSVTAQAENPGYAEGKIIVAIRMAKGLGQTMHLVIYEFWGTPMELHLQKTDEYEW